ncbi:MAG: pyruvate/2-oxoglutarate dehydrogenase complex,dihydrolipoamide dehydrogenase (E3) component [Leptolyngbya sp. ERB_1_1]
MAIVDSQGRLFGKVSILDVGAALVILMVVFGIFIFPGASGSAQGAKQPVEVDVIVRGLLAGDPKNVVKVGNTTNILVRKQPSGTAKVKEIKFLPRTVATPQPDGTLKVFPDPRPELALTTDMMLTLANEVPIVEGTPVLGGEKVKVGTTIELDGPTYNFASSVVGIRIKKS